MAISIISFYGVTFAVRSGGHSPNPGWSSVGENGILIDMARLNTISLSDDRSYASVGPGARWLNVYQHLDAEKAVVPGARVPQVGVGGFILGGMLSLLLLLLYYLEHMCLSQLVSLLMDHRRLFLCCKRVRPCCRQCQELRGNYCLLDSKFPLLLQC